MNNSKLYSILEHFDKYEQNRCRKYIISPYFNKNQALIDLYDVLIKNINSARPKELTREVIWKKIHRDKKFDDVRCRKYLSDLLKLVEGFLTQRVFEKRPLQKANFLIEAVGERKMDELYRSTMRSARRLSFEYPYTSATYYLKQYEIESNYYKLVEAEMNRSDKMNLEEIINSLDYFYFAEKLRLHCTVFVKQRISANKYNIIPIEEIIDGLNLEKIKEIPVVSIYYKIYLTNVDNENEEHYFDLKDLLSEHATKFPPEEANAMYTAALNYCIRKANKGKAGFLKELFDINEQLINNKLLFLNDELSPYKFQTIVLVALRLGKYDWTKNFINEYKKLIPINYRDNAVSYNSARLHFYQKNHDRVIQLLREVEYEDVSYNLGSKTMLLCTYYETDEIEPLYFLLESFRAYLNRHKDIPANRRNNYKNLIRFTKKLTKIVPGDKTAIQKLKEEINNTKGIADKKWLTEKIVELEN